MDIFEESYLANKKLVEAIDTKNNISLEDIISANGCTFESVGIYCNLNGICRQDIKNATIPYGISYIGSDAFADCINLVSVTIPDSVTSISMFAFSSCESLIDLTIPNSVTSIGKSAFSWCKNLKSITIPDSVISMGNDVFNDCDNLTIKCRKGSFAENYAIENDIPVDYI